MTTTRYVRGRTFEYKARDDLHTNGYEVVRAAGSKGGTKADLIAFKPGQLLLVQCKLDGKLPAAEWDRLLEVAGWVSGWAILAANGPRGRGITYTRLLLPKRFRAGSMPFVVDELAATDLITGTETGRHTA